MIHKKNYSLIHLIIYKWTALILLYLYFLRYIYIYNHAYYKILILKLDIEKKFKQRLLKIN